MVSFDKWYEKAEDKLLEEFYYADEESNWDEFVINKYEWFTSEIENDEYEKFKDERWDMKFQINLIKKFMLKSLIVMKIVKIG